MRYIEVTEHELEDARPGLMLIEGLMRNNDVGFTPYLYGLTSKEDVLLAATDCIHDDAEEENSASTEPVVGEVAIAVPFHSDWLYYLSGSGMTLKNEEFAYQTGQDAPRTLSFTFALPHPTIRVSDFSAMALADGPDYLDEFLKDKAARPAEQAQAQARPSAEVSRGPVPATKASAQRKAPVNAIDSFLAD